jgi:hypothetical protein
MVTIEKVTKQVHLIPELSDVEQIWLSLAYFHEPPLRQVVGSAAIDLFEDSRLFDLDSSTGRRPLGFGVP